MVNAMTNDVDSDSPPSTSNKGREWFDLGLRLMLSYQHEMAAKCFLQCLEFAPHCALAHSLVALCHCPDYNFKGDTYYESTNHPNEANAEDDHCVFPSQQLAARHSKRACEKVEELRKLHRKRTSKKKKKKGGGNGGNGYSKHQKQSNNTNGSSGAVSNNNGIHESFAVATGAATTTTASAAAAATLDTQDRPLPLPVSDVESQLIAAVQILTCMPGVNSDLADESVGRPYADAMRNIYRKYPEDAEVAYFFAEALMVLNAWRLYEYPTGRPLSDDVVETRAVLEKALTKHQGHAGLCHMYVHLSEMSANPGKALEYCQPLRQAFPHAGHLIHMPTHIDVLVGDYESCVRWNYSAALADDHVMQCSPNSTNTTSFYFGYIVHNYHMLVYGAILGGMEQKAMEVAAKLNGMVNEEMFMEFPQLTSYLEAYSALEVHVMVRFGRWREILELAEPRDKNLMLFRAATIKFAKALSHANLGDTVNARKEADRYDSRRYNQLAKERILHNNQVSDLLAVDAPMIRGEIAYRDGKHDDAFRLLRKAVQLQDNLNYDEPWGKMQPTRHALGGLLLEQDHVSEAEGVFRKDLELHPRNPFGLVGLIQCLEKKMRSGLLDKDTLPDIATEIGTLRAELQEQRKSEWADVEITVPCACCSQDLTNATMS